MKAKEIWYKQLGFHNNPFSIKPAAFYDDLLGYDHVVKKVNYSIATNKLVYVEGDYGNGKSTLLRRILHRFGGRGKIIYFSCNRIESSLNINKLLNGKYGKIGKLLNLKPKNMILLLDEAHWLPKEDYSRVLRYFRGGYFRSIVFVGKHYDESVFVDGFKGSLEHIKLGEISAEDAVSLIRKRVGLLPLLDDDMIKHLFEKADNNVRKLLKYCEKACKAAIERDEEVVTPEIVEDINEDHLDKEIEELEEEVENLAEDKDVEDIKKEIKEAEKAVKEEKPKEKLKEKEVKENKEVKEEKPEEKLKKQALEENKELEEEEPEANEEKRLEDLEKFQEVEDILEATPAEELEILEKSARPKAEKQSGKVEELYY